MVLEIIKILVFYIIGFWAGYASKSVVLRNCCRKSVDFSEDWLRPMTEQAERHKTRVGVTTIVDEELFWQGGIRG